MAGVKKSDSLPLKPNRLKPRPLANASLVQIVRAEVSSGDTSSVEVNIFYRAYLSSLGLCICDLGVALTRGIKPVSVSCSRIKGHFCLFTYNCGTWCLIVLLYNVGVL